MSQTNIKEKLQILQQKTTNLTTKNYKSPNNKNVPNKYKGKTTNLPTKNYKSPNKKLQISQQ